MSSAVGGHSLGVFMAASLALNLTPGADMLYVTARSIAGGFGAGAAASFGIAAGTLVHISLVAFGMAAVLATVPVALAVMQIAGACYLIYLGASAFRSRAASTRPVATAPNWKVFQQGAFTNVLNPKVALFFLAFVPQFVDPSRGSAALQVVTLGLLFNCSGTIVNLGVAYIASRTALNLRTTQARRVGQASGMLLVGLGVALLFGLRRRALP